MHTTTAPAEAPRATDVDAALPPMPAKTAFEWFAVGRRLERDRNDAFVARVVVIQAAKKALQAPPAIEVADAARRGSWGGSVEKTEAKDAALPP